MKKGLLLIVFCILYNSLTFGQTEIFNVSGGGTLPSGWSETNNITVEPIDKGSYYLIEKGDPSDIIETAVYDLSAYTDATFDLNITSFGGGSHNSVKIEISDDGGSTYSQTEITAVTTSSYVAIATIDITSVTNQVKLRFSNNGATGRSIRMQDFVLRAVNNAASSVGFDAVSSTENETNSTFSVDIPVTLVNYSMPVTLSAAVTGGTAESGDYTLNTTSLSFTGNETKNISVDINSDVDLGAEIIEITLTESTSTGITLSTAVHTLTILDDDAPAIMIVEVADPSDNVGAKFVAIENRSGGSLDISGWKLKKYTNANNSPAGEIVIPISTTLIAGEFYIFGATVANFNAAYGFDPDQAGGTVISGNGDDPYELTDDNDDVIDTYGVVGTDGTGENWEYEDAFVVRNAGVSFPTTAFDISEWTIHDNYTVTDILALSNALLPVELIYFKGTESLKAIHLTWQTASETNNSHFQIEHSTTGQAFETIGKIDGAGTTFEIQNYSFIHEMPAAGVNYYRLKQVDFDGNFEYSNTISTFVKGADNWSLRPTQSREEIIVNWSEDFAAKAVSVFDLNGKLVFDRKLDFDSEQLRIETSNLPIGTYILKMQTDRAIYSKRFFKIQ